MNSAADILIGRPIFSADGEKAGTMKEIYASTFKVAAPMQPDY